MRQTPKPFLVPFLFLFSLLLMFTACKPHGPVTDPTAGLTYITCSGTEVDTSIYYVSTSGSDEADGRTEASAFRTIARGVQAVKPGGTVRILPGTWNEGIAIQNCGSNDEPITIEGYTERPVMDGKNQWTSGIFCQNCLNFRFRNIELKNYTDIGVLVSESSKMQLNGLRVKENGHKVQLQSLGYAGYGIRVELSENIEISDCEVFRNGPQPQVFPNNLLGTGISTTDNRSVLIRNNKSFKNIGGGIRVEDSFDVVVEENEVYQNDLDATVANWWDGGLWLDGGGNVIVRDNHFHDNMGPGVQVSDRDLQTPLGYQFERNISTQNYYGIYLWNFGTIAWPDSSIISDVENDWTGNEREDIWIQVGN